MSTEPPQSDSDSKARLRVPLLWVLMLAAATLFAIAFYVSFWLPWQNRLADLRDIEAIGGNYHGWDERGPRWARKWFGRPYHSLPGNRAVGPFDQISNVDPSKTYNSALKTNAGERLGHGPQDWVDDRDGSSRRYSGSSGSSCAG